MKRDLEQIMHGPPQRLTLSVAAKASARPTFLPIPEASMLQVADD